MSITTKRNVSFLACLTSMLVLGACDSGATDASTAVAAANKTTVPVVAANMDQTAPPANNTPAPPPAPSKDPAPQSPATVLNPSPQVAPTPVPPPVPVDPNAPILVKAEPAELDLGDIPTMDSKTGSFKLVNTDTTDRIVKAVRPSCGCTTLKFQPDTVIPAGESIDIEVQMNGGMAAGPLLHKTVTVTVEGQPDQVVQLKALAVSFVFMDPAMIDPEVNKEGKFKVKSTDGQAFRIMSMQPPVIDGFPTEAQPEHDLTVDWDKFREMGVRRDMMFYLDHPKCQQTRGTVNFSAQEIMAANQKLTGVKQDVPNQVLPPQQPTDPDVILEAMIKDGKNNEVLEKIKSGLDVNHKNLGGLCVLSMAAKSGNIVLMSALLAAGADKEATDNVGRTPLMFAAQSRKPEAVRAMLDAGASVTARDTIGGTALSWASGLGDAQTVQELIDAGSDVEVVGLVTGWTPLIWAAGFGDPESIPILIKAKANIEAGDILQGATPLIHAARTGRVEGIQALLKAGAKLEAKDKNGKTALLAAADTSGGTAEKLQALIAAGADIHATDNRKLNALQLARKRTDIRAPDVIKILEPLLAAETPAEETAIKVEAISPAPAPQPGAADATNGHDHSHDGHDHDHDH